MRQAAETAAQDGAPGAAPGAAPGGLGAADEPVVRGLDELADIVLPPEVSLAPAQPGWWITGAALLVALVVLAVHLRRRHQALAPRRAALAALARARVEGDARPLPALLKRLALSYHPREEVASLTGERWSAWLDRTGGGGAFAAGAGATLSALAYDPEPPDDVSSLLDAAERWARAQGPGRGASGRGASDHAEPDR